VAGPKAGRLPTQHWSDGASTSLESCHPTTCRRQWQYGATGTPELSYCAMQALFWAIAVAAEAAVRKAAADRTIMTFFNILVSPDHDERECSPDIAFREEDKEGYARPIHDDVLAA
jgi:hypothetical protein